MFPIKMNNYYKQRDSNHIAAILLMALAFGSCYTETITEKVSYSGFALFRTFPRREQHITGLRALKGQECEGIEFWTEPSFVNGTVDIMVSPDKQDYFTEHLRHLRLPAKRIMHDVGEVIRRSEDSQIRLGKMLQVDDADDFDGSNISATYYAPDNYYRRYQTYSQIERKLQLLDRHPAVTLEVIGQSYERRKLYLVKVSTNTKAQKPVIFLDAGHHAREWISHSTIIYVLESLISDRMPRVLERSLNETDSLSDDGTDGEQLTSESFSSLSSKFKSLLDRYDFWFMPVVNPDGYEYTHTRDRLWRKTRSVNGINSCVGVDPNRNYPFKWGGKGTSSYSCSETYAGPKALSEPETRALADTIMKNRNKIAMYISLHAYSQVILMPYGYDTVVPKYYEYLRRVALAGSRAIYSMRRTNYKFGTSAILLYPAAGGSDDFAYEHGGIKYAYTIELPDTGSAGFLLPSKEIIPVGQEMVAGLTAMINSMVFSTE